MPEQPEIRVQLVHINGPLKGNIQEFTEPVISIGRHASSLVCFPADFTIVSRNHAEILREGNRFKLVDLSSNGSFVNGKKARETYLKSGDVLTFAENGPTVSFLLQKTGKKDQVSAPPSHSNTSARNRHPTPETPVKSSQEQHKDIYRKQTVKPVPETAKAPLLIQYGPTLRSFTQLPVTIGSGKQCDVRIEHEALFERHARVFFVEQEYWIQDLTGKPVLQVNGQPVSDQARLQPQDQVALSPEGPFFIFLGGGRFAESETV